MNTASQASKGTASDKVMGILKTRLGQINRTSIQEQELAIPCCLAVAYCGFGDMPAQGMKGRMQP